MPPPSAAVDPSSGYCAATGTFHSLREPLPLPPPDCPLSFPSFAFSLFPSSLPSHPALVDSGTGEAVPFPAFLSRVRALAVALRVQLRVSPGDVTFVLAPPGVHIPVLYYALMSVGAVVTPANPALTAGEISSLIALSNPSLAFAIQDTSAKLPPDMETVLLDSPKFLSLFQEPHDHGGGLVPGNDVVIHQSDPAAILFSSGTTGRSKAVELTHRNLISSAAAPELVAAEVLLLTVPLFHVYGFLFCVRTVLAAQKLVLYTAKRFSATELLTVVGRYRATRVALAPPALLAIVLAAEDDNSVIAHTTTLQATTCGGASISPQLIRRFKLKFPHVCLLQGYGLTETTGGFCRVVGAEESARIGSVGRLSYGVEAKIVHPDTGVTLPPGTPGEILVRGPFVMKGYLGDKDSTSTVLDSEGWLRTGDICYVDKDGFIFIIDRLKELIKYKGYQVPPAEIENLLQTHSDIVEAAVVPYPDERAGELPVAFIVRCGGSNLDGAQIKEYIEKQVVHCKRIHRVFLVNALPKNAAGKILRKDLVKLALQQLSSKL